MKSHARVVVVGGGVMGVGLLYHLALEGWSDIVLIEKLDIALDKGLTVLTGVCACAAGAANNSRSTNKPSVTPACDHALRWAILRGLVALVVGVIVAFSLLLKYDVILILERPILPFLNGNQLVYTHPADPFRITMSMAFALGAIFASPVLVWQIWGFLSPALYKHEKRVIIPVLIFGALLFLGGVSLAFFGIIPITLKMFYSIQTNSLTPMITAGSYFDFVVSLSLLLGAVLDHAQPRHHQLAAARQQSVPPRRLPDGIAERSGQEGEDHQPLERAARDFLPPAASRLLVLRRRRQQPVLPLPEPRGSRRQVLRLVEAGAITTR